MTKAFETATAAVAHPQEWLEFTLDGHKCRAQAEPSDGQVAFLMARAAKHVSMQEKIIAMLNFFDSALDDDTQAYLSGRLLDPKDPFGAANIEPILAWLMEEWSGHPTQRSSGSTLPPTTTGSPSTEVIPVSI
jgi:hypothetical protein